MDIFEKFQRKVDLKFRKRIEGIIAAIRAGQLEGLNIKPMTGHRGLYRCRIRDVRIIFTRDAAGQNILIDIDFRGNIYKK